MESGNFLLACPWVCLPSHCCQDACWNWNHTEEVCMAPTQPLPLVHQVFIGSNRACPSALHMGMGTSCMHVFQHASLHICAHRSRARARMQT
eukprot:1159467-Pelagomonas_calceolata.AAC.9